MKRSFEDLQNALNIFLDDYYSEEDHEAALKIIEHHGWTKEEYLKHLDEKE